jgi:hypothetical protein
MSNRNSHINFSDGLNSYLCPKQLACIMIFIIKLFVLAILILDNKDRYEI